MVSADEQRIKHLEFIQAVITRQATNSFTIKGWSITVSSALYAYTASNLSWWLALISIVPGIGFGLLDAYYLHMERMFRELYQEVADENPEILPFSMDVGRYKDGELYPYCRRWVVWQSRSVWILYLGNVVVGLFLLGVAIFKNDTAKDVAECIGNAL